MFGAKGVSQFFDRVYKFEIFVCYTSWFSTKVILLEYWIIMASPGSLKGQRHGTCGHAMAAFDSHEKCARCRDKKVGDDPCVKRQDCVICEGFTDAQCETLSTPSYKIRKDRRSGSLVSPKDVTIISAVDMEGHSSPQSTAQVSCAHTCSIHFLCPTSVFCHLSPI